MEANEAKRGIRSYGPGKFYNIVDSYVYEIVMNGFGDESASYEHGDGGYDLVRFGDETLDTLRQFAAENNDKLTADEEDLIEETAAVILYTRSDGIVEAEWFDDEKEADEEWEAIEEEVYGDETEGDE